MQRRTGPRQPHPKSAFPAPSTPFCFLLPDGQCRGRRQGTQFNKRRATQNMLFIKLNPPCWGLPSPQSCRQGFWGATPRGFRAVGLPHRADVRVGRWLQRGQAGSRERQQPREERGRSGVGGAASRERIESPQILPLGPRRNQQQDSEMGLLKDVGEREVRRGLQGFGPEHLEGEWET